MRGLPLIAAAGVLALAGCRAGGDAPPGALVVPGTVDAYEAELAFEVGGRIVELAAEEGATVEAGALLARLDEADLALAAARARAEARAARAAHAALAAGSRPQEIRAARAAVREAAARLRFARAELRRTESLVARELASPDDLDRARLAAEVAEAALAAARERLALVEEGPRREEVERAAARLEAARKALALRERALAKARLLSPFAGTVTARLAEVGEVVTPGRPVLRLARTDPVWVRAYLEAPELARVRLGQRVEVRAAGLSAPLAGRLAFVSPRAEFTPKTVETREVRAELVYRIRVDVPNPGGALKIGQPVELRFAGGGG